MQPIKINRNLSILLSGQLVSQVGDKFYMLALAYWTLETTGSPALMGVVLFASMAPLVALGFVSGAWVDRHDRKQIVVGCDLFRGGLMALVAAAAWMDVLHLSGVIAAQVLLAVNAAFFNPAIPAIIPQIVNKDQLARANAKTQFVAGFANIVGPALGGLAVASLGFTFAFLVNAASFLVSALFELFLRLPPMAKAETKAETIGKSLREGYAYLAAESKILIIILMVAVIHFFVGSIEVIIPVLATDLAGNGARNMGYIQTFFGLGSVLMAAVISMCGIDGREVPCLFGSVFLLGGLYGLIGGLGLFTIQSVLPYLLLFALVSGLFILAGTSFQSLLQKSVPNHMAGRVFGIVGSVGNGAIPLAVLLYGILMSFIDHDRLLIATGIILLPLAVSCYRGYGQGGRLSVHSAFFFKRKPEK